MSNKARNQTKNDPVGAQWFKNNIKRRRKASKSARKARRKNR